MTRSIISYTLKNTQQIKILFMYIDLGLPMGAMAPPCYLNSKKILFNQKICIRIIYIWKYNYWVVLHANLDSMSYRNVGEYNLLIRANLNRTNSLLQPTIQDVNPLTSFKAETKKHIKLYSLADRNEGWGQGPFPPPPTPTPTRKKK